MSSTTISFTNFQLVFMQDYDESQTLAESEVQALNGYMPDYSDNSYQFDFLGYTALGSYGEYNGEQVEGKEDYRNVYRIEEYKDAGMTILYLQSAACIPEGTGNTFDFATSKMKQVMDMALEAEMTKVVACDYRIVGLSNDEESLIGEGKKFATQAALDAQIKKWMDPYASHGAFYGVQLVDEPSYTQFTALGQIYRSIKRLYPDAYVHCNLLPCTETSISGGAMAEPSAELIAKYMGLGYGANAELLAGWEGYLTGFLDATGADYIMYDRYPLTENGTLELYTIDGKTYQALSGMTWERWCNSSYNTDGYFYTNVGDESFIYRADSNVNGKYYYVSGGSGFVSPTMSIFGAGNSLEYRINTGQAGSHGGGSN